MYVIKLKLTNHTDIIHFVCKEVRKDILAVFTADVSHAECQLF